MLADRIRNLQTLEQIEVDLHKEMARQFSLLQMDEKHKTLSNQIVQWSQKQQTTISSPQAITSSGLARTRLKLIEAIEAVCCIITLIYKERFVVFLTCFDSCSLLLGLSSLTSRQQCSSTIQANFPKLVALGDRMAGEKFERAEVVAKRQADVLAALNTLLSAAQVALPVAKEQLALEEFKEKTNLSVQVHSDLQKQV